MSKCRRCKHERIPYHINDICSLSDCKCGGYKKPKEETDEPMEYDKYDFE